MQIIVNSKYLYKMSEVLYVIEYYFRDRLNKLLFQISNLCGVESSLPWEMLSCRQSS